jgi:hypothetical protein
MWIALIVVLAIVAGVLWRYKYGLPPGWPTESSGYPVSFKEDHETEAFMPDWDDYKPQETKPPPAKDPGWDS